MKEMRLPCNTESNQRAVNMAEAQNRTFPKPNNIRAWCRHQVNSEHRTVRNKYPDSRHNIQEQPISVEKVIYNNAAVAAW
jgi:hypothetical protein